MTNPKAPNWQPPAYAEEIDGMWWTPKMVMHYRGLSSTTYYKLRQQRSMRSILRSEWLASMKGKWQQTTKDNSQRFVIGGREYSMMMLYHVFIIERFFIDFIPTYAQFNSRCRSYQQYGLYPSLLDGVYIYATSIGRSDLPSYIAGFSQSKYNRIKDEYLGSVSEHRHQDVEYKPLDLQSRYIECLWADPKMHGLYYQEILKAYDNYKADNERLKADNERQAMIIASLRSDVEGLQKQLLAKQEEVRAFERYNRTFDSNGFEQDTEAI